MSAEWSNCLLGDFVTLKRGYDLPYNKRVEGNVPVVSSSGVSGYHCEAKVKGPGVVTGRYGTLGEVFFIEEDFWPLNTTLYVQDFKGNDPRFASYFLKTLNFALQNVAGAVPGVNRNILHMMPVQIPPLPTQRKIAAILSAYDDLIENNTRRIKILEEMAQALYREWFVHFRFPGHEKVLMVDSAIGMIPEGWEVRTLACFGKVVTGKTPSKKVPEYFGDYLPFIKTPDMHGDIFCIDSEEKLSELGATSQNNKTLPPNSICVSCIGTAGIVAITGKNSQTNQQINSIVLDDLSHREFLYFALSDLKETINQYGANGATMVNLNKGKFEALKIVFPDRKMIIKFSEATLSKFEQIKILQLKNANLRRTRDLLLPKLISGDLNVENLEIKVENLNS
jgi:type I restriction enzyme, S subunit